MKPLKSHLSESRIPGSEAARRSLRLASSPRTPASKHKRSSEDDFEKIGCVKKSRRSLLGKTPSKRVYIVPATLNPPESKKKRQSVSLQENKPGKKRCTSSHVNRPATKHSASLRENKPCFKRSYYKKVIFCGWQFKVDDDVYVRRREDAESDDDDPVEEECMICFETGGSLMLECDDCLCGFHLQCLRPPLQKVPEGDWICEFCEAKKIGKPLNLPTPPEGKKRQRTAREKLLSGDLWAARIESLWKEPNGTFWLKCRWYIIPEETSVGRQPHNLRRELYRTNHVSDIEMESIFRHCYVMEPREFGEANNEGDDVFYCEYEYDVCWHSFKRLAEVTEPNEGAGNDKEWKYPNASGSESEEDSDFDDTMGKLSSRDTPAHELAANSRKGRIFGLHKIGLKKIPEHVRLRKTTALERAKSMLLHADLPKMLPCRVKEMEDITAFIKGTICKDYCLGRCLYIHGVPGTGKTMTVHTVLRNLRTEVDTGKMRPYSFVEVNGLKLASPEYIYKVIYEALSGQSVGWKKALSILNERFSEGTKIGKEANQPCILLVDELDLLLTRNQSVLYNLFDWPTKPDSKLIVIGIANTMDLPEKFLPRISSRMGIQRLCFGPYQYQQLKEIILSRLKGIDVFDEQAIEFASRKVAAMSGDARRALEICRRAADVADYRLKQLSPSLESSHEEKHLVGMDDIEAAIREVFQAPHIQIIKTASRLSKIMLAAMIHELYRSGLGEVTFQKLATTICSMCINNRETEPGLDTLLRICCKLGECRIIISEEGAKNRLQKLQLNFPRFMYAPSDGHFEFTMLISGVFNMPLIFQVLTNAIYQPPDPYYLLISDACRSEDVSFALKDCLEIPWLAKYL